TWGKVFNLVREPFGLILKKIRNIRMDMSKLCSSKQGLRRIVGVGLALVVFAGVGCNRSDRAAVEEPSSVVGDSDNAVKRSKKGMYSVRMDQDSVAVGQPNEVALVIEP